MKSQVDIKTLQIENKWLKRRIAVLIEALEHSPNPPKKVVKLNATRRTKTA